MKKKNLVGIILIITMCLIGCFSVFAKQYIRNGQWTNEKLEELNSISYKSFNEIVEADIPQYEIKNNIVYCYDIDYKGQYIHSFGISQKQGFENLKSNIQKRTGDVINIDTIIGPPNLINTKSGKILYFTCFQK